MSFLPEPVVEDEVERKGYDGEVDNVEHYLQMYEKRGNFKNAYSPDFGSFHKFSYL